ncbi:MAG: ATP-binding cassette domain-containing protein [Halanaerobiales bacterium]|nr:ATP-binding cassette domain-containing protein [Halanaerobiales bacterium]
MVDNNLKTLKKLNVPVNEVTQVETLSGGQRQSVAVCRAVAWAQNLIIMDEPTAALGVEETENVLKLIKKVQSTNNTPVLIVSHNMPDVFAVADRIVILRLGNKVGEVIKEETSMDALLVLLPALKFKKIFRGARWKLRKIIRGITQKLILIN